MRVWKVVMSPILISRATHWLLLLLLNTPILLSWTVIYLVTLSPYRQLSSHLHMHRMLGEILGKIIISQIFYSVEKVFYEMYFELYCLMIYHQCRSPMNVLMFKIIISSSYLVSTCVKSMKMFYMPSLIIKYLFHLNKIVVDCYWEIIYLYRHFVIFLKEQKQEY